MDTQVCAYVAGFFDGEGSISIKSPGKKSGFALVVSVSQYHPLPIELIHTVWGGYIGKGANGSVRVMLYSKSAGKFLADIYPYLIVKKQQAEQALAFQQSKKNNGRRGTEKCLVASESEIKTKIESLNRIAGRVPITTPDSFAHACVPCAVESPVL